MGILIVAVVATAVGFLLILLIGRGQPVSPAAPENLAREGFDVRRFSLTRPRLDWSDYLRERYARARLTDDQDVEVLAVHRSPSVVRSPAAQEEARTKDPRPGHGDDEGKYGLGR